MVTNSKVRGAYRLLFNSYTLALRQILASAIGESKSFSLVGCSLILWDIGGFDMRRVECLLAFFHIR